MLVVRRDKVGERAYNFLELLSVDSSTASDWCGWVLLEHNNTTRDCKKVQRWTESIQYMYLELITLLLTIILEAEHAGLHTCIVFRLRSNT